MGYQRFKRPLDFDEQTRIRGGGISTAASTALQPNQILALHTSASAAPVVYTIADNVKAGDVLELSVYRVGSSSGEFHINAQTSGAFGYAGATTAQNMLKLSTAGAGVRLLALNATEWAVIGAVALSTST